MMLPEDPRHEKLRSTLRKLLELWKDDLANADYMGGVPGTQY